jgi:MFS family permease
MKEKQSSLILLLIVASLGYFVDAYDLLVFSVVRSRSIVDLGLGKTAEEIKSIGIILENWQSLGLLLGGLLWGIIGDKIGRKQILYGSITLYSIANLLNGLLIKDCGSVLIIYSGLRFLSGLGLAGELGAGITLVTESMKTTRRGIGTMLVAVIGFLGCVTAAYLGEYTGVKWNMLYLYGGLGGLLLLMLRFGVYESTVFMVQKNGSIRRGAFYSIFTNKERLMRYLISILVGLPVYFVIGLPIKFANNFGDAFNVKNVSVAIAIMTSYLFVAIGDVCCNILSQIIKSRKIILLFYNILNLLAVLIFIFIPPKNAWEYQFIYCPMLGFSVGYWALIVTNAAEQFGTNIRATVATTVPNIIRSTFIPISLLFILLEKVIGTIYSAAVIGVSCSLIGIISAILLKETFFKELDYVE